MEINKFQAIPWETVEIGKQYKLEEGYYFQADVTVLDKIIEDDLITYEFKIDKAYTNATEGEILRFSKSINKKYSYLTSNMKFKPLDGWFDYMTPTYNPLEKSDKK